MSIVSKVAKLARSPEGKRLVEKAQHMAKDPETRRKLEGLRSQVGKRR